MAAAVAGLMMVNASRCLATIHVAGEPFFFDTTGRVLSNERAPPRPGSS
jgi:hypothetical protein